MEYLSVKNWNDFQQYKDRDPKWIKLHRDILNNYEFDQLTEVQQNHLMKIWLLASKLDNRIPNDATWIGRQIGAKSKVQVKQLVDYGFIELYGSVQDGTGTYLEGETEGETETETDADGPLSGIVKSETWKAWIQYRKEIKKSLKPSTREAQVKSIVKWNSSGYDCNEIIATSIRNGWTGLFSPEGNKKKKSTNGSSVEYVPDDQLNEWAARNNAPPAKQQVGYTYDKYREDLIKWEQAK